MEETDGQAGRDYLEDLEELYADADPKMLARVREVRAEWDRKNGDRLQEGESETLYMDEVSFIENDPTIGPGHTAVLFTHPKWGVWGVCSCGDDFGFGVWQLNKCPVEA